MVVDIKGFCRRWLGKSWLSEIFHCFTRCCLMSTLQKSWPNCQHLQRGRHYQALYPCHVCTLLWPPIVVQGQKVALWCAKWFTAREDTNNVFVQEPGQEVPSNFKQSLWINNSPRSISLLSFYFPSLPELSHTVLDRSVLPWAAMNPALFGNVPFIFQPWNFHNKQLQIILGNNEPERSIMNEEAIFRSWRFLILNLQI